MKRYNLFGINNTGAVVLRQSTIDYMRDNGEGERNPLLKEHH